MKNAQREMMRVAQPPYGNRTPPLPPHLCDTCISCPVPCRALQVIHTFRYLLIKARQYASENQNQGMSGGGSSQAARSRRKDRCVFLCGRSRDLEACLRSCASYQPINCCEVGNVCNSAELSFLSARKGVFFLGGGGVGHCRSLACFLFCRSMITVRVSPRCCDVPSHPFLPITQRPDL